MLGGGFGPRFFLGSRPPSRLLPPRLWLRTLRFVLPYALAIFTGAFLLFQVQPLIGKYILPWYGGGPGVWTTCLLFFQVVLLAGYAYAHFVTRHLKPRAQALLHGGVLIAAVMVLPIAPGEFWKTQVDGNPTWSILLLLAGTIGLPYLVLSSTGPLMQQWFSSIYPTVSPYRLYALSNVASLLALLSYPVFFEVKFTRHQQSTLWSATFVVFAALASVCAFQLWRLRRAEAAEPRSLEGSHEGGLARESGAEGPTVQDKALWVALPAVASVLLLATTNKLCQEIAVIPFLWVLPLSLYLLTFVICFDHARWYVRPVVIPLAAVGIAVVYQIIPAGSSAPMGLQIAVYTAALFLACLFCHGELYRLKPPPRHLTSFYLAISAGGALGGLLVAIVAPAVLKDYHELPIGLAALVYLAGAICLVKRDRDLALGAGVGGMLATFALPAIATQLKDGLSFFDEWLLLYEFYGFFIFGGVLIFIGCVMDRQTRRVTREWQPRMAAFVMGLSVLAGIIVIAHWRKSYGADKVVDASRNFYGTLKVYEYQSDTPEETYHLLLHGATTHGVQFVAEDKAMRHTTYYGSSSGVGLALSHLATPPGQRRIGLVGLGTGTLASYGQPGDYLRIYEINPEVERLARRRFTYLERSPAKVDVIMGDARLSMERELEQGRPQKLDLLALDAFSSDAIPVHLLTKEAFALYLAHIKDDGVIAVHTSNRYLELQPVVERLAQEYNLIAVTISDDDEPEWWRYRTTWILVTRNAELINTPEINRVAELPDDSDDPKPLWTDDHASLYEVLR